MDKLLQIRLLLSLGVVVMISFGVFWSPFLFSLKSVQQVLHRIFPFQRGLFEDYVANFWYVYGNFLE